MATRLLFFVICIIFSAPLAFAAPRIGVSGQSASSPSVIALMAVLRYAGAEPIFLGDHASRNAAQDLRSLDALVVAGNNYDIDPAVYGKDADARTVNEMSKGDEAIARAKYEYAAIELALKERLPVLGICGGMQRLNVGGDKAHQGTLIQHVDDNNQWKKGVPPYQPSDEIIVARGTLLAGMSDSAGHTFKWGENSLHHQAADKVRLGFRASAHNKDGLIEAIEPTPDGPYAGQFALGVQWHPEYGASNLQRGIVDGLLDAAKKYQYQKH